MNCPKEFVCNAQLLQKTLCSFIIGCNSQTCVQSTPECDQYIRIIQWICQNIFMDVHSYWFVWCEYIQTFVHVKFVCTNIFIHLFVSVLECENYSNEFKSSYNFPYRYVFEHTFMSNFVEIYSDICFYHLLIRIYTNIPSCWNFYECHTLVHTPQCWVEVYCEWNHIYQALCSMGHILSGGKKCPRMIINIFNLHLAELDLSTASITNSMRGTCAKLDECLSEHSKTFSNVRRKLFLTPGPCEHMLELCQ